MILSLKQTLLELSTVELTPTVLSAVGFLIHLHCQTVVAASRTRAPLSVCATGANTVRARDICTPVTLFVPASGETYEHHGKPIMQYTCTLSDVISAHPLAVTLESFLADSHLELSVGPVQIRIHVCSSYALLLAKAEGLQVLPGLHMRFLD
jgi:hypothetical protein